MGRPITLTVGPLASASATTIGLSQKAAGARYLVLNGASGSFSANNICLSQTPGGAVALTLNGSTATTAMPAGAGGSASAGSAIAYLAPQSRIYITGGSDESGKTFAVVGTRRGPNSFGPGVVVTETITGPNASVVSSANAYDTIISITSSAGTTGAITVGSYSTATLDTGRRVIITSGGDDTGITFTLTGTNWYGNVISETITGVSGAAASSVLDYLTVTSILTSAAVATTVTVGTNGVAGSPWLRFEDWNAGHDTTIAAIVDGTVNYTVQHSMDDPDNPARNITPAAMTWINSADTNVVAATATKASYFDHTALFGRVLLSSGSGTVTTTFRQADNG